MAGPDREEHPRQDASFGIVVDPAHNDAQGMELNHVIQHQPWRMQHQTVLVSAAHHKERKVPHHPKASQNQAGVYPCMPPPQVIQGIASPADLFRYGTEYHHEKGEGYDGNRVNQEAVKGFKFYRSAHPITINP